MPIKTTINVRNASFGRARRVLTKLEKRIEDTSKANRDVSIWLLRWVNQNFRSEGGKVGGWAPFKYGGRVQKDGSINTRAKLLQKTGALRKSFLPFYSRANAGVGSFIPYAEFHELGTQHLPVRRMLPEEDLSDPDVEEAVIRIYEKHLLGGFR